jgi:hypothetical protein
MYHHLREALILGSCDDSAELQKDLLATGYERDKVRRLKMQSKKNLSQSPDLADAMALCCYQTGSYFSGVAETDWSWCPLVADFDNDGLRDLVVTNGFPKDVTDRDFIAFRQEAAPVTSQVNTLSQIPEVKLHNYAFHNNGNCQFTDATAEWGLSKPSFSNGAAYADLDNDGDLDIVINNINDEAFLYENNQMNSKSKIYHYLSLQLLGDSMNINGLGTWVELYYGNQQQAYEQTPYRGYLSSIQLNPHFGLGGVSTIDSLVIKWPDGAKQVLKNTCLI